jgi:O-antigen/teichoic acid export membrane protein
VVLTALITAALILGASLMLADRFEPVDLACLQLAAIVLIFQQVYFFFSLISKLQKKFFVISRGEFYFSAVNLMLVVCLIVYWDIFGLLIAMMVSYGLIIFYIVTRCNYLQIRASLHRVVSLFRIGCPIMIFIFLHAFLRNIDKLAILIFLSRSDLGFYGITSYSVDMIFFIPSIVSSVVGPSMTEKFGRTNDIAYLKRHLFVPIDALACILPVVIGIFYLSADLIVTTVLPQYIEGIWPVKILTLAGFFFCISHVALPIVVTLDRQRSFLVIVAFAILLGFSVNLLIIRAGFGIAGVAAGTGAVFFVYCCLSLFYVSRLYDLSFASFMKYLLRTFAPFIYSVALLAALDVVGREAQHVAQLAGITVIRLALFCIFMCPVALFLEKKTGIFRKIGDTLRGK